MKEIPDIFVCYTNPRYGMFCMEIPGRVCSIKEIPDMECSAYLLAHLTTPPEPSLVACQ